MLETTSLCPVCFTEIPAIITIDKSVNLHKFCPNHGSFCGVVEKDSVWFAFCRSLNCKCFYSGYMVDVTDNCNLKCKYCYHKNASRSKTISEIKKEFAENTSIAPFILSGGEPTVHTEIKRIIEEVSKYGPFTMLTNGIMLSDKFMLESLAEAGLLYSGTNLLCVSLSLHKEANGKDIEFLVLCKKLGLRIETVLVVIDELTQIDFYIELFEQYKSVIGSLRIKAASNIWNTSCVANHLFVSDMLAYLEKSHTVSIDYSENNKVSYASIICDGLPVRLISWYDLSNIDLQDVNCAPYYKAKDGVIRDLVSAFIINGGIDASLRS